MNLSLCLIPREPESFLSGLPFGERTVKLKHVAAAITSFLEKAVGNYIGVAPDGSVHNLDHEYNFLEWADGKGTSRLAGNLKEFALILATHRGRWWWQGGWFPVVNQKQHRR